MKKKLLFATIILVLLAGVLYYISLPDYLVFNSMSFSNGANRDTELQVIVYQYWNADEVVAEIEATEPLYSDVFAPFSFLQSVFLRLEIGGSRPL